MKKNLITGILLIFLMFCQADAETKTCKPGDSDTETAIQLSNQPSPDYPKIIQLLEQAKNRCPKWSAPSRYLGDIMSEQGKYTEAVESYLQALEINNRDFETCLYLGDVYKEINQPIHALRYYAKGIQILESDIYLKSENQSLWENYVKKRTALQKEGHVYTDETDLTNRLDKNAAVKLGVLPKIDIQIEFDFNKASIASDSKAQLDTIAEVMNKEKMRQYKFIIQGHTDIKGNASYNQQLSERRAASVQDYLLRKGVTSSVVEIQGRGETCPVSKEKGETDESWHSRCRRVVFISCDKNDSINECLKKAGAD